ncbi:MAG: hypothetical protein U0V74_17260 [Chitinophagales bacterium]
MRLFLPALLLCLAFSIAKAQEKATIILKSGFSNLCYIHNIDSNYVHYSALGIEGDPQDSVKLSEVQSINFVEHFGKPLKQGGDSVRIAGNIYSIDPAEPRSAKEKSFRNAQLQTLYNDNYKKGRKMYLAGVVMLPASVLLTTGGMAMIYSNSGAELGGVFIVALLGIPGFITGEVLLPIGLERLTRAKAVKSLMPSGPPTLSFHPSQIKGSFGDNAYGAGLTLNF